MEWFQRAKGQPRRLGVLPGTFNPVTVAHVALARAALARVDEVVFVLPRVFPHKAYSGASFEERVELLRAALADEAAISIAAVGGGLFAEIAQDCRAAYGADVRVTLLCGRDAAERMVNWDYGRPGAVADMLREFDLLVAARGGGYRPPPEIRSRVASLEVSGAWDAVSASEVRRRIAGGEPWEELVPEPVRGRVRRIYQPPGRGEV